MFKKYLVLLITFVFVFSLVPIAMMQSGDPLAPDGETAQTYYAPFPVDITLDGDLADWEGVPRVRMAGLDTNIVFAAAANADNMFFMADVTDSNIISGEHGVDYWNEDSVEFYLNGTGDLTLRSYIDGVSQVTVPALNKDLPSEEAILSGVQNSQAQATVEVVETETGYRIEMAVPLETDVWSITPAHGETIGFQVHLNGASTGNRDTKLIWSMFDTSDQSYLNPGVFGYLIFYEIGQTDRPEPPTAEEGGAEIVQVDASALYRNGNLPPAARVIDLMARMTLDEKIAQMTLVEKNSILADDITELGIGGLLSGGGGYPTDNQTQTDMNTPAGWAQMVSSFQDYALQSRLAIPLIYGVDAVHGHNNMRGAVIFPHNIGLGATRDADLVAEVCRITALEMVATGIYWNYSPVVAVPQDIRWGRTYEAFGQDTDLVSELATACLTGMQGEDLSLDTTVLGTPKHYVGDGGAEWGTSTTGEYQIDQGVMNVDEATLREIHLPPYIDAVENGAQSIMISYSSWNELKMHAEQYLITEVLKGELGFDGFIVTDWAGVDQISDEYYDSVVASINAGIDMVMVPYNYLSFIDTVKRAVNNGDIEIARIDDAVRRILTVKFEMGLFEHPYPNEALLTDVGSSQHRAVARQAVAESQVLLKNDGDLLPLGDVGTVFIAGEAANDIGLQSGGWTIEWQGAVGDITEGTTILEGIQNAIPDQEVVYSVDGTFEGTAPVGIVVVSEQPYAEGVGDDPDLILSDTDLATIDAIRGQVDQLVVVIISGRPLMIANHMDNWDAVVAAWLPGSEGAGVADVLLGYAPFTGTLPVVWPKSVDQLPLPIDDPLFEFGYGLATEATREMVAATHVLADFEAPLPDIVQDSFGNNLGFVPWGDVEGNVALSVEDGTLAMNYNIGAWGGFSHVFSDGENWTAQDWRAFEGLQFSLFGNNTGGTIQVEIFDNRTTEGDSAERWFYHITDDFEGWQDFQIPFSDFQRRSDWQPGGAPDDGFGLNAVSGYAFGLPAGTGPQTAYLDNIMLYGGIPGAVVTEHVPFVPGSEKEAVDDDTSAEETDDGAAVTGTVVGEAAAVTDFEMDELPDITQDEAGNNLGFVAWGDTAENVVIAITDSAPDRDGDTHALEINYNIGAWGGFAYGPGSENVWTTLDWTAYDGLQFWLYGNETGGIVQLEIFDNRNPDIAGDSAERWFYRITDDYAGWKQFTIPFSDFQRRSDWQPDGAPDDGLGLDAVSGYAFGFPAGVGSQTTYLDQVEVVTLVPGEVNESASEQMVVVDDFELDALPAFVQDEFNNNIGYVPWGDTEGNVAISVANDAPTRPDQDADNTVLAAAYDISAWGGFSHVFTDGENWVGADWSDFYGIQFWYYGNNTGGTTQFEIFDNRAPGGTTDSAERWFYHIADDYEGWQLFQIPFSDFQRRTDWQPDGAPDDGLGLNEVSGYAFGFPAGVGSQTTYIDQIALYGGASDAEVTADVPDEEAPETEIVEVTDYPWDGEWTLIWADEFDAEAGSSPNPDNWTCEIGGWGWGNQEHQFYTDRTENVAHNGEGQLVITAIQETLEDTDCWYGECQYTSARCISRGKVEFTYGKVEARMRLPYGQGIWPALWMLGADFDTVGWPDSGEIDIMENIGMEPTIVHGTIHGPGYSGSAGIGRGYDLGVPVADDYHVYGIEWEPNVIRWYVDGEQHLEITPDLLNGREWVYNHDFFLIMNLAVGGEWPGYPDDTTVFPQTVEVDWLRVYQRQ